MDAPDPPSIAADRSWRETLDFLPQQHLMIFEKPASGRWKPKEPGFASLHSRPAEHHLAGFDGIVLRILGEGKTYGVRLRTDSRFDGASYQAKLATEAGRWAEVELPFSVAPEAGQSDTFPPVYRGRLLAGELHQSFSAPSGNACRSRSSSVCL